MLQQTKKIEKAPETIVNHSEGRPPSLEVTPTNEVSEATTMENSVKDSEVSTTNKTSEDSKGTSNHVS